MDFWNSLWVEAGARRRQLRRKLGDRGQSVFEFALLSALALGSVGLFARPGGVAAAPWGFLAPALFLGGYLLLDILRQADVRARGEGKAVLKLHRRLALGLAGACAMLGAAAFATALGAGPPPPPSAPLLTDPRWAPPRDAPIADIVP